MQLGLPGEVVQRLLVVMLFGNHDIDDRSKCLVYLIREYICNSGFFPVRVEKLYREAERVDLIFTLPHPRI
ncbi:hypothetical protein D3C77_639790 [compost metagenome]